MGACNIGPKCSNCSCSPEECIGCNGYPSGTIFIFNGEQERPIIEQENNSNV